ncbi:MAG: hypothetical protein H6636_01410 [Anaerolineales bacterium]|nr:hypothetical protein [Anaerolineales bacterium]
MHAHPPKTNALIRLILIFFLTLPACTSSASPPPPPTTTSIPSSPTPAAPALPTVILPPAPALASFSITAPTAYFLPGETARWTITISTENPLDVTLVSTITSLAQTLTEDRQPLTLAPGNFTTEIAWTPPVETPRGYGLDLRVETPDGEILAQQSTAFDVLENWTQNPRYGFLTNFVTSRQAPEITLGILNRYHINGLQFYDWMYRHDTYMPPEDLFKDPLGRDLSMETTRALIDTAHQYRMAAMPYTAIYAASSTFYRDHADWGLYQAGGEPATFGGTFLYVMDPRPEKPWGQYLLDQFTQILTETTFDGIHLDQFGWPKDGYDAEGHFFQLDQALADMINATSDLVKSMRGENGAVIFNAVTNWPINTVAPSQEDVVYIEVWEPYTTFNHLHELVNQGQTLGGGKPVVLAAYLNPDYANNVLLMDAVIFGAGGGHLELGENARILADPYFPKYKVPSDELLESLQRYYDFAVRYQNVLGPTATSVKLFGPQMVSLAGVETAPQTATNKVMPIMRESEGHTAISLVNLLGLEHGRWHDKVSAPTPLENAEVTVQTSGRVAANVWVASPDQSDLSLQPLDFQQDGETLTFTLPALEYWSLILIEWNPK